ncbi:winged helix DNA-binding domain-containing protein [Aestuariimicrobium sp. T2.26MG-19.2B]|uniref:winged helix DNA-binding domain-containing protein n=1 Tax=Aestuariimicrobium sp. T2.26MG-19.2B TaxID=3040679 RepID=UPI0024773616|nr:winged helix DNA-binding domain-containing protein [Aestuariimicrobium sp. T2.26MG-19.2B]CAI9406209.1 hypothetical protein AESSP_01579 [Aestuariimicrobium sp. T2.26MG-19.2B]
MVDTHLGRARLLAQGLVTRPYATPTEAVRAHGAMQGQDLPGAIASAALRTRGGTAEQVIADLDAGRLVRGYPMRGTVFLMAADDVAWVSQLCNAPMLRAQAARRGQLDLHEDHVEVASELTARVLAAHERGLPRAGLMQHWDQAGVPTDAGRGYHVLSHLIGRGEVAYGPWNGVDQNVVGRDRLPAGGDLEGRFNGDRTAATAELLRRYLISHGPATLRDFAWWTKLPQRDIRPAFTLIEHEVERFTGAGPEQDGEVRFGRPGLADELAERLAGPDSSDHRESTGRRMLLPGFDEFVLGYQDRMFAMSSSEHHLLVPGNNGVFKKSMVSGGRVVGTWARAGRPGKRSLELVPFGRLAKKDLAEYERLFEEFPFPLP